jgi:integrase
VEKPFAAEPFFAKELRMTLLRRRMTEDMQVRNLSLQTQATYVQQVSLFARHFKKSPELLGPEDIRSYQVYLTNERKLAPSSIIIAVAALRFLYKVTLHRDWNLEEVIPTPKKPQKLPIVLTQEEVLKFLASVRSIKHRTILTTCYGAGLRVSEAICLKVTDIDSERMLIRVQRARVTRRLPAHPLLWLHGQPIPGTEIGTLPRTLGHANARTTSLGNRQGLSRALRRTHWLFVVAVPSLSRRSYVGDPDLAAISTQAGAD